MERAQQKTFTEGPIFSALIKFALPVLFALFLQSLYGAVDLIVVGQFGTAEDVSAVSTGSQLFLTVTDVVASLAMGITILLGQQIGGGHASEGGRTVEAGLKLLTIFGLIATVVFLIFAPNLAGVMNAPEEAFSKTVAYLRICGAGTLVIIYYNLIGAVFRAMGDSMTPLITVAIACVVNIFGDLLLIAGFHMGAAGAAIATVSAQFVSVVVSFVMIRRKDLPFRISFPNIIKAPGKIMGRIAGLGIPLALSNFLVSISFLVILAIVNRYGLYYSAGIGVAEKVCAFIMLVSAAFSQSMAAIVAQNYGAGKYERTVKVLKAGIGLSLCCGIVMGLLTFFFGNYMAGIFSKDAEIIQYAWDYLKAYAFDCFLTAFLFCFIGFYNGVGMTRFVMTQSITGAMLVRVPVSFLMSTITPVSLFRIGLATPCSTVVQIILCFIAFAYYKKKIKGLTEKKGKCVKQIMHQTDGESSVKS